MINIGREDVNDKKGCNKMKVTHKLMYTKKKRQLKNRKKS